MGDERGLSTVETVVALALCAAIFIAGLGIGGAFDSGKPDDAGTAAGPAGGFSATVPSTSAYSGEPSSEQLAALSLATASAAERAAAQREAAAGASAGAAAATAAIVAQGAAARQRAAERAAYWGAVGVTLNSLHGLAIRLEQLRKAEQVRRAGKLIRRLQARAIFALGRLRQMQVGAERRRLSTVLLDRASRAVERTVAQSEQALAAAGARAAAQATRELNRTGTSLNRTLAEMEGLYVGAVEAAASGDDEKAEELLVQLEEAAAEL